MLNRDNMPADCLKQVKRHLNITWSDSDTDDKIIDIILGAEGNYFAPGMQRRLFLNYMLYAWNDCLNEFEDAYRKEILRIRHYNRVKGAAHEE